MSLPSVADCKAYLKIENTAEDALLAQLLARATMLSQNRIGCPIQAASRSFVDEASTQVFYSHGPTSLIVPVTPIDPDTLDITDQDGNDVDSDDIRADARTGIIKYLDGSSFDNGPYTIECDVGLSLLDDYATMIEPIVSSAIIDFVADLYQRRNPGARAEAAAGGVRVDWGPDGIPPRVCEVLDSLRRPL